MTDTSLDELKALLAIDEAYLRGVRDGRKSDGETRQAIDYVQALVNARKALVERLERATNAGPGLKARSAPPT